MKPSTVSTWSRFIEASRESWTGSASVTSAMTVFRTRLRSAVTRLTILGVITAAMRSQTETENV